MDSAGLVNAAAMTAVVTLMVSLFTPFVESLPGLADGPRHDAALRLLNIVLQVVVVFVYAAATSGISPVMILPLLLQALAQAAGAHFAYHVVTGPNGSMTADNGTGGPTPPPPADVPPGAPSVAALGLPNEVKALDAAA